MKYTINQFKRYAVSVELPAKGYYQSKKFFETVIGLKTEQMLSMARLMVLILFIQFILTFAVCFAQTQEGKTSYPVMAPLDQYLIKDKADEIALARSAAPPSVSGKAEVMVLGRKGYTVAVKGTNGFVCIVERSWTIPTDDPEFWNPKMRAPICYNPQAAKTYLPFDIMKAELVLAGKSKTEIAETIASAFDKKKLPAITPGAMSYMMSKQQYLNDQGKSWHPHLMFYRPGKLEEDWGANLQGSPVIASYDSQLHTTIFMVWVGKWSDGTLAPPLVH